MRTPYLRTAVLIPLLGLCALIVRAEWQRQRGHSYLVAIGGYDPRDLLSGHYLTYRYQFTETDGSTCRLGDDDCCVCFLSPPGEPIKESAVQMLACDAARRCPAWLRPEEASGRKQYFVPETRAAELERQVRQRRAAVELRVGGDGHAAIKDLYIDGHRWEAR